MTAGIRLAIIVGVLAAGVLGWAVAGYPGAATGVVLGVASGVIRWWRQPAWGWLMLWRRRKRAITLSEPITVANDRAGGGVRYQDGVAVVAVQLLGKAHRPTLFTGSTATYTDNTVDVAELLPLLHQSLGLSIESLSVVSVGARRRSSGDYPRVYDTLIGTPPYAGQRETWLIVRIVAMPNASALKWRTSAGTATLAAAQRIAAALRQQRYPREGRHRDRHRRVGAAAGLLGVECASPALADRARRGRLADRRTGTGPATSPRRISSTRGRCEPTGSCRTSRFPATAA